jgi:hypothetical protein
MNQITPTDEQIINMTYPSYEFHNVYGTNDTEECHDRRRVGGGGREDHIVVDELKVPTILGEQ